MSIPVLITPRVINECIQSVSPPYPPIWAHRGPVPERWPSAAVCVASCRHLRGKGQFGGPTGGFGDPKGALVVIVVSL